MSDLPDFVAISYPPCLPRWPGFPHRLALLPAGHTFDELLATPRSWATFLIEPDSAGEVLNGAALNAYLGACVPIVLQARRARDLRPFLRRVEAFRRRGYEAEMLR